MFWYVFAFISVVINIWLRQDTHKMDGVSKSKALIKGARETAIWMCSVIFVLASLMVMLSSTPFFVVFILTATMAFYTALGTGLIWVFNKVRDKMRK